MAEAYVKVLFDVGDSNDNVPFQLNIPTAGTVMTEGVTHQQFYDIIAANWTSRSFNATNFWVAYLLGAFQESVGTDHDPGSEDTIVGGTPRRQGFTQPGGGCFIFIESNADAARDIPVVTRAVYEQDTVVHEIGHAVGARFTHPVTGADSDPVGAYSRYTPVYINSIRSSEKPLSRSIP